VVSLGKAVLDGALGYARSTTAEEVALQLGVERDAGFVADKMEMMQSFLMAAAAAGDDAGGHHRRDDDKVLATGLGEAGPRHGLQRRGQPRGPRDPGGAHY